MTSYPQLTSFLQTQPSDLEYLQVFVDFGYDDLDTILELVTE